MAKLYPLPKLYHPDFALPGVKPKGPVVIDWDNPIARGLQFATISSGPALFDLVKKATLQPIDANPSSVIEDGNTAILYGSGAYYTTPFDGSTQEVTFAGTVKLDKAGAAGYVATVVDSSDGSNVRLGAQYNEEVRTISVGTGYGTGISSPDGSATIGELKAVAGGSSVKINKTWVMLEQDYYSTNGTGSAGNKQWDSLVIGGKETFVASDDSVTQEYCFVWNRVLSEAEMRAISRDPYQILKPAIPAAYFIPDAAGGITGTGALSAASAALSATGEITKTGTGALTAQASAVAGTGLREITGTAALTAQASAVAGTGLREITGTAALAAQAAAVAGAGQVEKTGTGALAAGVSTVAGVGTVGDAIAGTGTLEAQAAAVSGAGIVGRTGTGALESQAAQVAGAGSIVGNLTGTGALIALDSTIAGVGVREITGTGALASQAATISGAEVVVIYDEIELAVTITREQALQMTVTREVST